LSSRFSECNWYLSDFGLLNLGFAAGAAREDGPDQGRFRSHIQPNRANGSVDLNRDKDASVKAGAALTETFQAVDGGKAGVTIADCFPTIPCRRISISNPQSEIFRFPGTSRCAGSPHSSGSSRNAGASMQGMVLPGTDARAVAKHECRRCRRRITIYESSAG